MNSLGWILRPIVWFATASMATTVLHELTHATVAYALGVRSTLFNYHVNLDLTPAQAATNIPALIRIAGPLFCLGLGMVALVAFRRTRGSAAELPLLFLAVFGIGTFFGNLMSASFVGDFSAAAIALRLPMPARYAASLVGACCAAAVHFWAGRELARWVPSTVGRVPGMFGIIVLPAIIGTAVVILANLPSVSVGVRSAEAAFWVFAAIGALVDGAAKATPYVRYVGRPFRGASQLRWVDGAALLVAVLTVHLLVRGIPFVP